MTEPTQPTVTKSIPQIADEMPKNLPYALREAMAELQVHRADLPRVPEAIFIRDILPVLTGEEGQHVDMVWWGGRFGNPFLPFLIVNQQNEVVFEVPPFLDRNFVLNPARERDSLNEDRQRYAERAYNRPAEARAMYEEALRKRIDFSTAKRPLEHMQTLDKIFKHYGKPSIFEQAEKEEVKALAGEFQPETIPVAETPSAPKVYASENYDDEGFLD